MVQKAARYLGIVLVSLVIGLGVTWLSLQSLYTVKNDGVIYLENAPGVASITRETDTGIAHVRGEDFYSMTYAQGYAHAQTRLWQMQLIRLAVQGRTAEYFGEKSIGLDKFMRSVRVYEIATQVELDEDSRKTLQAYIDGINDFVSSVAFMQPGSSANLLPLEFYIFGMSGGNLEPWTVTDTVAQAKMINFHMSQNWGFDLLREQLRQSNPMIARHLEELAAFADDNLFSSVSVADDDDLKEWGLFQEGPSLTERYNSKREHVMKASPPLDKGPKGVDEDNGEAAEAEQQFSMNSVSSASNAWAIHGNYTNTGMPLFAGDPHLQAKIPAIWQIQELVYGDNKIVGASLPGAPLIFMGRSASSAWSVTSPNDDNTDLWQEEINPEGTHYKVDGEWRELTLSKTQIKIKGKDPIELTLKATHRGQLMSSQILKGGINVTSGQKINFFGKDQSFSLGWAGRYSKEVSVRLFELINSGMGVKDFIKNADEIGKDGYFGIPANLVMADTQGDIGFIMLSAAPKRLDQTPFLGCRVLDGTVLSYDWADELLPLSANPRSVNPKKGFVASANNRQASDHAKTDIGSGAVVTPRGQRIDAWLRSKIASGIKLSLEDMETLQKDLYDIQAAQMMPQMLDLAEQMKPHLSSEQVSKIDKIIKLCSEWNYEFTLDSPEASVFSFTQLFFIKNLMKDYPEIPEQLVVAMADNHSWPDVAQHFIKVVFEDPVSNKNNHLCRGGFGGHFTGEEQCAYNVAMSFIEAHDHLVKTAGQDSVNWAWKNFHTNEYPYAPFSLTALKSLFHRSVPAGGSVNTIQMSKFSMVNSAETLRFKGVQTPNYKQVVQLGDRSKRVSDKSKHSLDTGDSGSIFDRNYFSMNDDFMAGRLHTLKTGEQLKGEASSTLVIRPKGTGSKSDVKSDL